MIYQQTFAIGIPTINRWDLLQGALDFYNKNYPSTKIFIIDNGRQGIPFIYGNATCFEFGQNLGVAASWNRLCRFIFLHMHVKHALILNDDILLGYDETQIIKLVKEQSLAGIINNNSNWSSFIISRMTFSSIVGHFDEQFKGAYFEDNDYSYRLDMAGIIRAKSTLLDPIEFRESASSKKDPSLLNFFQHNKDYYISKWGGIPGEEKFTTPFGK